MDTCPMCFSPFKQPKLLPCLDTVCFACLDEYVVKHGRSSGTFPCPVCNLELDVPDGGISKFDENQHIKSEQSLNAVTDVKLPCEVCEEKQDANHRCIDCEQNFCKPCGKAHLRLNIAKNHTLVNIGGPEGKRYLMSTGYCDKHTHEELIFYCRTCLTPVCMRCRLTTHEDHTTEDLVDFAIKTRRELRLTLDENKGYRFNMLNEIEELRVYGENVGKKKTAVKKAILQRRQQFHHAIDKICESMLERLNKEVKFEIERIDEDKDAVEQDMLTLSNKIATANQMVDFGSDMEVVKNRQDILGSLAYSKKEVPLSVTGVKLNVDFSCQKQAELSLKYLLGRLSTDIVPPTYIDVSEVSTFRVENTSDVINSICPSPDGKCWVACGWKPEIYCFDRYGQRSRVKKVGRDVDCLAIDADGNSYVSCRDEHSVKRFDRNFRRRMATLNVEYPRGIAATNDNKLIICVNETTTYFDYETKHQNKVLKLGPEGNESKELKNPSFCFMYPIRVAVNINNELCVSDNLKHAVMFLRPNGELKAMYSAEKHSEIALVKSASVRKFRSATRPKSHKTSTPRPGASSFKSRKEQDGPLSATPKSILDRTSTPPNSPKTAATSGKELAPLNLSYESTFDSSMTIESNPLKQLEEIPKHLKALTGMTGALDSASVSDAGSEAEIEEKIPEFDPRGITCDKYGHVIVADYSSNLIHLLDKHGRFLMYLLSEIDGIFGPTSVAVDNNGFLWVGGGDATVKIYRYINTDMPSYI